MPNVDRALAFLRLGISVIPLPLGTKRPTLPWKPYQTRLPTEDEVRAWWSEGERNIALVMGAVSGLIAVDCDDEQAEAWAAANLPRTTIGTRTKKGKHRFYRHPGTVVPNKARINTGEGKLALDVRGDGGYVLAPGSLHPDGGEYIPLGTWTRENLANLPVFDVRLLGLEPDAPPAPPVPPPPPRRDEDRDLVFRRARAWLEHVDPAIQGSGGDAQTLRAAAGLVRGFLLDDTTALLLLEEWNTRCVPPWTTGALQKKLRNARKHGKEPMGGKLDAPPPEGFNMRADQDSLTGGNTQESTSTPYSPPPPPDEPPPPTDQDAPQKEDQPAEPPAEITEAERICPVRTLTDLGNAERLVSRYGHLLHWCPDLGGWLNWDGKRWCRDALERTRKLAAKVVRRLYAEAADHDDEKMRKAVVAHAKASEAEPRRRAMLSSAQFLHDIPVLPTAFDNEPWLLNVQNGTVDLRTGELRPHRKEDLQTKLCNVPYDRSAPWRTWGIFLDQIMEGQTELALFLQRAVGYSLSGYCGEQVFFFLYGSGANGKSTFLQALLNVLGNDYATRTDPGIFAHKEQQDHPTGLARLRGIRFLSCNEMPGGRLDEDLVKQLTGEDRVVARFLHHDFFEFEPQFHIWMAGNHRPEIRGTDEAIWRRPLLVPFQAYFPPQARDKHLAAKLQHEAPGILAWAVHGALQYKERGLDPPAGVRTATQEYRSDQDILKPFLEDRCVMVPGSRVAQKDLRQAYLSWCEDAGEQPVTPRTFALRLGERGIRSSASHGVRSWMGLALVEQMNPVPYPVSRRYMDD